MKAYRSLYKGTHSSSMCLVYPTDTNKLTNKKRGSATLNRPDLTGRDFPFNWPLGLEGPLAEKGHLHRGWTRFLTAFSLNGDLDDK